MGSRESAQRGGSTHKPMQKIFDSEKAVGKHSHKQYLTTHRTCQKSVTAKFSSEMYGFLRMFTCRLFVAIDATQYNG